MKIKVERTGATYSMASVQYLVTFPDDLQVMIWSPPWNEWTDEESDVYALKFAEKEWERLKHDKREILLGF